GRSFERARKASRMKEEKEVRLPQKPVARPMYRGVVFLCVWYADWRAAGFSGAAAVPRGPLRGPRPPPPEGVYLWVGGGARSSVSSIRKPMKRQPAKLAQRTGVTTGAPG
ncbi:hypothetical protein K402DRAFT_342744, partial [Aulographum hederae CBS 113979]